MMTSLLFKNTVILKKAGAANSADIVKIAIILTKATF